MVELWRNSPVVFKRQSSRKNELIFTKCDEKREIGGSRRSRRQARFGQGDHAG
jgi:hypothetical protein